jgi:dTMP kinase
MLITFYGVNNIGKSTQAKMLVSTLIKEGHKAIYLKYPVYDMKPSGTYINQVLRNANGQKISEEELQMWFALNRFQFEPQLKKYLSEDYIVIAEDYTATSLAWGSAKGADENWLDTINIPLIKEDLAILINGERTKSSIEDGHIHETNDVLISKVSTKLLHLSKKLNWHVVDRQEKLEETQKLIFNIVKKYISC